MKLTIYYVLNDEIIRFYFDMFDSLKIYSVSKIEECVLEMILRCLKCLRTRSYFDISKKYMLLQHVQEKWNCVLGIVLRYGD